MVTCVTCVDVNGDLRIDSAVPSKSVALPGETIAITVTARNISAFFPHWMNICLIDNQSGQSQMSDRFELSSTCVFGPCNNVKQVTFFYVMPNYDVGLSFSLIEEEADKCEATKTVALYVDTGIGTHKECIGGICQDRPGPGTNQCSISGESCAPPSFAGCSSSSDCGQGNMCMLGLCVPSAVVGVGILAVLFMLMRR